MSDGLDTDRADEADTGDTGEEVIFRRDGTVFMRLPVVGRFVLRRPNYGELRTMHEEILALGESEREVLAPLNERVAALNAPFAERIAAAETEADVREIERDLAAARASDEHRDLQAAIRKVRDDGTVEVLRFFDERICATLARPRPVIERPEVLPGWIAAPGFLGDLIKHWQSVPLRPGA